MSITITLDKSRCKAVGSCLKAAPGIFSLDKQKVCFANTEDKDKSTLTIDGDEQVIKNVMDAAFSCPTNAILIDDEKGEHLVQTSVKIDKDVEKLRGSYDEQEDFVLDPQGYFLIRTFPQEQEIEVGFCKKKNLISVMVRGNKPKEIYHTLFHKLSEKIQIRPEHAAYLGKELEKAYLSLKLKIEYVQDSELELDTKDKE